VLHAGVSVTFSFSISAAGNTQQPRIADYKEGKVLQHLIAIP
jgi:hypothetical protein